jgi:hypothetical protein
LKFEKGILKLQDAFLFIILIAIISSKSYAQDINVNKTGNYDSKAFKMLSLHEQVLNDTIKKDSNKNTFVMKKSPWKAVLYSAILPGLGQFYNGSYWKVPVIAILSGYFGYEIIRNNNKFIDYRDLYAQSQSDSIPEGDLRLKQYREFYRNQRDNFYLYSGIFYLINLVDAYVDAHMFDFDVSDKVKFSLKPANGMKVNFNVNF